MLTSRLSYLLNPLGPSKKYNLNSWPKGGLQILFHSWRGGGTTIIHTNPPHQLSTFNNSLKLFISNSFFSYFAYAIKQYWVGLLTPIQSLPSFLIALRLKVRTFRDIKLNKYLGIVIKLGILNTILASLKVAYITCSLTKSNCQVN